jgi:tryptophan-rich sensory protein
VSARDGVALAVALAACLAAGAIGSVATVDAIPTWYAALRRPAWNPPNWLFGPVWATLYVLMGVAAWLVWRRAGWAGAKAALLLFAAQLLLNAAWSLVFFGLRRPGWAFVEIVVLWAAIALTLRGFWRLRPLAGALLVPYLAWVTFAAALNFAIWRLNIT